MMFWPLLSVLALLNFIFLLIVAVVGNESRKFTGSLLASFMIDIVFVIAWFVTRGLLS